MPTPIPKQVYCSDLSFKQASRCMARPRRHTPPAAGIRWPLGRESPGRKRTARAGESSSECAGKRNRGLKTLLIKTQPHSIRQPACASSLRPSPQTRRACMLSTWRITTEPVGAGYPCRPGRRSGLPGAPAGRDPYILSAPTAAVTCAVPITAAGLSGSGCGCAVQHRAAGLAVHPCRRSSLCRQPDLPIERRALRAGSPRDRPGHSGSRPPRPHLPVQPARPAELSPRCTGG